MDSHHRILRGGSKRRVILPSERDANLFGCDVMDTRDGVEQHRLTLFRRLPMLPESVELLLRIGIGNGQDFRSLRVIV
jgi:hypothetical protein